MLNVRRFVPFTVLTGVVLSIGMVSAFAAATTEIDRADAVMDLQGAPKVTHCAGEDATTYTQYTANYTGSEADLSPAVPTDIVTGGLDHGLAGPLTLSSTKTTFNDLTGRGVLKGTVTLSIAGAPIKVYKGTLTLIVQRQPATIGNQVFGRGWLSATTYRNTAPVAADGYVLANVEAVMDSSMTTIHATFGDTAPPMPSGPVPDFSVETGLLHTC
jgi:hypothetical protein